MPVVAVMQMSLSASGNLMRSVVSESASIADDDDDDNTAILPQRSVHAPANPSNPIKKPFTSFIWFGKAVAAAVREGRVLQFFAESSLSAELTAELKKCNREGTSVSGQLMGKLWRALDDTGKAIYKEQAVRSIPPCCCVRVLPACAT
jgi:hypothetical protein